MFTDELRGFRFCLAAFLSIVPTTNIGPSADDDFRMVSNKASLAGKKNGNVFEELF